MLAINQSNQIIRIAFHYWKMFWRQKYIFPHIDVFIAENRHNIGVGIYERLM